MLPLTFKVIVGETRPSRWLKAAGAMLLLLTVGSLLAGRSSERPWLLELGGGLWVAYVLVLLLRRQRASGFVLDGAVVFTEEGIETQGHFLPLAELRRVEAHFTYAKGAGVGTSSLGDQGNNLLIYQQQAALLRFNVLIESRAQRTGLDALLRRWRAQGLDVVADVF